VPELMQANCTASNIANAVNPMLDSSENYLPLMQKFDQIHLELKRDASVLAANAVLGLAQKQ